MPVAVMALLALLTFSLLIATSGAITAVGEIRQRRRRPLQAGARSVAGLSISSGSALGPAVERE